MKKENLQEGNIMENILKSMRLHVHAYNKHLSHEYLNSLTSFDLLKMVHPYYVEYYRNCLNGKIII